MGDNLVKPLAKVPQRWLDFKVSGEQIDIHLSGLSKSFMKYKLNVFLLQRYALRVQHWFFYKRLNQPKKSLQKTTEVTELPKPAISTEKYKKLNGTQRIPKAAEKHL